MIPFPIRYAELNAVYGKTLGHGVSSLAVVGPEPGCGVSTLAYALARRSAAGGNKTLLVDVSMANPSVGPALALAAVDWRPGDESALSSIVALGDTGLSVLAAPRSIVGAWAFRDGDALRRQVAGWLEHFERVIVDSSPVNRKNQQNIPSDMACAACEGTVLVAQPGRTSESSVLEAADRLRSAGANILGGVLNDQYMPPLAAELCRETYRLERWFPRLMAELRLVIRRSKLLDQEI